MMYSEKVTSSRVPVASICTSAVPAGHPEPRRETPLTLTVAGVTLGALRALEANGSVDGAAATREAARGRMAKSFMMDA